ncbi:MAG TPA: hypothetical protein VM324_00670 [Egibacteraceae bacterium]|jgi:hypothetical protein|nr:hypothetical protein [Egibacteraceae bacterium]
MVDRPAAVHLTATDAVTVLRLLEGLGRLLRAEAFDDAHRSTLVDGAVFHEEWQAKLAEQVAAATGLIRQQLDGYDVDAVMAGATRGDERDH